MEQRRLKLNEFKAAYKTLKTGVPWVDHLLLGLLSFLEGKLINERVENEVNEAINTYKSLHTPPPVLPVFTETPSELVNSSSKTSESLPEMRLTAPWYIDGAGERSEP